MRGARPSRLVTKSGQCRVRKGSNCPDWLTGARHVPQMRALYEMGYTILSTNTYKGMIKAHKAMPDVM